MGGVGRQGWAGRGDAWGWGGGAREEHIFVCLYRTCCGQCLGGETWLKGFQQFWVAKCEANEPKRKLIHIPVVLYKKELESATWEKGLPQCNVSMRWPWIRLPGRKSCLGNA